MDDPTLLGVAWTAAVAGAGLSGWLWSKLRAERKAVAEAVAVGRRIAGGESHVVAPGGPGSVGDLAGMINALGERIRHAHLKVQPDRVFEQAMLRETPNGLLVVDGKGIIRSINPSARAMLAWAAEPIGTAAAASIQLPDLLGVIREAGETRAVCERPTRSGSRDLLVRGLPLADGGGVLGVVLDITSVVSAERVRREFVSNVSHELRTPVTAIVGYAESLAAEPIPASARVLLDPLVRNAMRLNRLCDDVLALSQIEARAADLPLERVDVRQLAEEVVSPFADRAGARKIKLDLSPTSASALLHVDAFSAALSNLVDNALKYTPEGGKVHVGIAVDEGGVEVSVTDNGPGIDPAHHPRLFERFYRVDVGRSRDAGGTGLGLALVKHYCKAMGAVPSLRSAPGEGSTFSIRLRV